MKKLSTLLSALLCGLCASAFIGFTGCASSSASKLLAHPPTTHVVHVTGNGNKYGIGYDTLTGQAMLGVAEIYASVTTIPVFVYVNPSNGVPTLLCPNESESFEIAGKSMLFGSQGITHTLATERGVYTQVGGAHQPINEGFYGTNNLMTYGQLVTSTGAATPTTTTTVQKTTGAGTNAVTTTTTTTGPSSIIQVPGF